MSEAADFARARRLPPAEAIAYMQGRGLVGETYNAYDLWRDEHSRAHTISRLARADLLEATIGSLTESVAGDLTRRDWIRDTETLLRKAGWWGTVEVTDPRTGEVLKTRFNHPRLQLIFDTNVRQAQAAGQWQRMLRNRRTHPYARYVTQDDDRVRPLHKAWHNTVLPLDDTWWATHRPPNGYRCRCRVVGVTRREYDAGVVLSRPGATTDRNAPVVREPMNKTRPPVNLVEWTNPATGDTQLIPAGIDPGFDYNPGTTGRSEAFDQVVEKKLARLPAPVAEAARSSRLRVGLPSTSFVGQRPGLATLDAVSAPRIPPAGLGVEAGAAADTAALAAGLDQALQALQRSGGLVNDDTGWLLRSADTATRARLVAYAWELRALVRQAVVLERYADAQADSPLGAVLRLVSALVVDERLYRVNLQVRDSGLDPRTGAQVQTLQAGGVTLQEIDQAVGQLAATTSGGRLIPLAVLLRSATLRGGGPVRPD